MRRWLKPCLFALVACTNNDFDPASYVSGLRVLAVKAEPPEVAPGESSTLSALAVDTQGRAIGLHWFRCLELPLPGRSIADDCVTGADAGSALMAAGDGSPLSYTMPAVTQTSLGLPDSTGGFYLQLIARANAGESDLGFGYRLRLAGGAARNTNPTLTQVLHDSPHPKGATTAVPDQSLDEGTPVALAAGQEITLRSAFADGSVETYEIAIPGTPTRTVTEALSFNWFATAGSFSEDVTSPDRPDTKLRLDVRVPAPGTTIDLWVVGQDERGGTDFLHRTLVVQ